MSNMRNFNNMKYVNYMNNTQNETTMDLSKLFPPRQEPSYCNKIDDTPNKEEIEKIRKSITVRGLSGLKNLGNTCYMNAGLQCLLATTIFTTYIKNKNFVEILTHNTTEIIAKETRKKNQLLENVDIEVITSDVVASVKKTILYNYYSLIKAMWSDNVIVEPYKFKAVVGEQNALFKGYQQNDSQELINFVLIVFMKN